jgi:outer membrane protein OmpU
MQQYILKITQKRLIFVKLAKLLKKTLVCNYNLNKGEKMTNFKKIGLTALAGALASTTVNAGELSVSGNAIMEYQADTRNTTGSDNHTDGFVMNSTLTFSGSGELDNGMTVSMYQSLASGSVTSEGVTLDMGDMGKLSLDRWGYHTGITSVADKIPTAGENVHDDTNDATGQVHDNQQLV